MLKESSNKTENSFLDIFKGDTDCLAYSNISLSELILFLWAMGRSIWYILFGVVSYNFEYILPQHLWIAFFTVISTTHFIGMYLKNSSLRITAIGGYALAWGTLAVLAAIQTFSSAAFPSYIILTIACFLVIKNIHHAVNRV